MKKEYNTRENYCSSHWQIGCECGHVKCEHESGFFRAGQCQKCLCPKFKEDEDGIYSQGYYIGSNK